MSHPSPGKYAIRKCRSSGKWLVWWPNSSRPTYGFVSFGGALRNLLKEVGPVVWRRKVLHDNKFQK